jgi:hypothetical protein
MQKLFNTTVFLSIFLGGGGFPNRQATIPSKRSHQPQVHSGTAAQRQYAESVTAAGGARRAPLTLRLWFHIPGFRQVRDVLATVLKDCVVYNESCEAKKTVTPAFGVSQVIAP